MKENTNKLNIGSIIASKAIGGVLSLLNTPNFVEDNNAFVRQEQGKAISYRYGTNG